MASGVAVEDECLKVYEEMKLRSKFKYAILGMKDNDQRIGVLTTAPPEATYEEFVEELRKASDEDDCRYAILDFDYKIERSGGSVSPQHKLLFYVWCPDTAKIRRKMLYSSSKDALKKKLTGIHVEIQACDFSDLDHAYILEKVMDKGRRN